MFFQSPRPFGQHSTSYKSVGNSMRSAVSMTSLPSTATEMDRSSVPSVKLCSTDGQSQLLVKEGRAFSASGTQIKVPIKLDRNLYDRPELSYKKSTFFRVSKKKTTSSPNEYEVNSTTGPTQSDQIHHVKKTNSYQDAFRASDALHDREIEFKVPTKFANLDGRAPFDSHFFHRNDLPNNGLLGLSVIENSTSYNEEFSEQNLSANRFRSSSAVPFTFGSERSDNTSSRTLLNFSPFSRNGGSIARASEPSTKHPEHFLQTPSLFSEQKPAIRKQAEKSKNYATLQRVTPFKVKSLQRHTSDPNLIGEGSNEPVNMAMFNVARGVKAELENNPKFLKKVELENNPNFRKEVEALGKDELLSTSRKPIPPKVPPKQSPSLRQLESVLSEMHRFPDPLENQETFTSSNPSLKLFSVDHVRSIFRSIESPLNSPSSNDIVSKNSPRDSGSSIFRDTNSNFAERATTNSSVARNNYKSFKLEEKVDRSKKQVSQSISGSFPADCPLVAAENCSSAISDVSDITRRSSMGNNNGASDANSLSKNQKHVYFQLDEKAEHRGLGGVPVIVGQYDEAIGGALQNFLVLSSKIGGDVQTAGDKISATFDEQRNFIWMASGRKEPSANELQEMLAPIVKKIKEIGSFRESKRNTQHFNHISAMSEGVQAVGWLTVKQTPASFLKEMQEASMYFINRVLKDHKESQMHVDWAKGWVELLNCLQKYVRQAHTTGLVWNIAPGVGPSAPSSQLTTPIKNAAPPPPPPVLPPDLFTSLAKNSDPNSDRCALFAEINAGEGITKRLKKVSPDMQTHKNANLRAQNATISENKSNTSSSSSAKNEMEKPPKTWLENGKQWNLEYHKNNKDLVITIENMKQTIYVYKCQDTVIQVNGKLNSITLDSCKKTSIVFDSLLSQIEVINCQGIQIQTLGAMPTLSIQKTDGCQVFLSKEATNSEIITSKSSGMNILVPAAEDGDFVEYPVPEQFKTIFDGKRLKTTASDV